MLTVSDRDCQDARVEVLIRDAKPGTIVLSDGDCKVVRGEWFGPYTRQTITDAPRRRVGRRRNREKGDKTPDRWRPENRDYRCAYAQTWANVKFCRG